ncbi:MAG: IclR family transcriptional regulator [Alcaligenaceae bacterium]|nr:IclR family transcriptional regulator [Alcaligenaceae bacterium]
MQETEKTGNSVRAVERALEILMAFDAEHASLTVSDLLKRVDLSRPTLYRLLYTLEEKGFVSSSGDPQRFSLGPAVGRLAWAWSSSIDIAQLALPVMREIWDYTGETVALFLPRGDMRICAAELPSTNPLSFRRGVGYSERIALGASGRAILAWMDPTQQQLESYCQGLALKPSELSEQLKRVRSAGYAISQDELMEGAAAVAVPFFQNDGRVAGSIAVFGPVVRLDEQRIAQLAPVIMEMIGGLSSSLGAAQRR